MRAGVGVVHGIQVSPGGVPKLPVVSARVGREGLAGDGHRHPEIHGGRDKAVCVWSLERIEALRAEGHPIAPGAAGENLTVAGIDWDRVVPGVRLRVGDEVVLDVVSYTTPCRTIAASFRDGDPYRIAQARHPGWSRVYARVVTEGEIRVGDPVEIEG